MKIAKVIYLTIVFSLFLALSGAAQVKKTPGPEKKKKDMRVTFDELMENFSFDSNWKVSNLFGKGGIKYTWYKTTKDLVHMRGGGKSKEFKAKGKKFIFDEKSQLFQGIGSVDIRSGTSFLLCEKLVYDMTKEYLDLKGKIKLGNADITVSDGEEGFYDIPGEKAEITGSCVKLNGAIADASGQVTRFDGQYKKVSVTFVGGQPVAVDFIDPVGDTTGSREKASAGKKKTSPLTPLSPTSKQGAKKRTDKRKLVK
jgi:lipopolysaccharide export system protein LptA